MGVRKFSGFSSTDVPVVTTAETVIASVAGTSTNQPGQQVAIRCVVQFTVGASTTALTLRIRRDSLTGTAVGEANVIQISTAAGSSEEHVIEVEDAGAGEFSGRTYVCTVAQTAATGNGTALQTEMTVECTP